MIFYLLSRREWESATTTVATPSDEDGFVHCCDEPQIEAVRLRYFSREDEILALAFDPTQLSAETRYEPGTGGEPERFPHVYGSLPRESVVFVREDLN